MWLKHVEALRPGSSAALLQEAENASRHLRFDSFRAAEVGPASAIKKTTSSYDTVVERVLEESKFLAIGFIMGIVAYLLIDQLPLAMGHIPAYIALVLTFILGYGAARRFGQRSQNLAKSTGPLSSNP
jgi:hypothetical protein